MASGSFNRIINLWGSVTGKELLMLNGHSGIM
jgi:hypothetical protein